MPRTTVSSRAQQLDVPPIDASDLVIVSRDGEQPLGHWAAACLFEADHAGTATITVQLVEEEHGELARALAPFLRRDGRTGAMRMDKWNTLRVHDTNYILRELARTPGGLDLVCYDEASEDLKRYKGPVKWSRGKFTRAEGIKGLANEAGVRSHIPDMGAKQPIADLGKQDRQELRTGGVDRFNKTYPAHYLDQPDGRTRLSAGQVRAIAESVGFPPIAGEQIARGESQFYPGVVQRDPGDGMVGYGLMQITPNAWGGSGKLLTKLKELGGIAGMRNPVNNFRMAKYMFDLSGLSPWYGKQYLTEEGRQQAAKWPSDAGGDDDGTVDRAFVERYEFSIAARENYWVGTERLLNVVRWRRFAIFNHLVVASDTTLTDADPYAISLDDEWLDAPEQWVVTSGQRIDNVPLHGRLAAIIPPGTHVAITDDDPLYGTWLVRNFKRDLLDPEAEVDIVLGRPVRPLPEPASTVKTIRGRDGKDRRSGGAAGWAFSDIGSDWSPKAVIDRIVVPLAAKHGMGTGRTPAMVEAANARHGLTVGGNTSDHQGPPDRAWAADMSDGSSPTPGMDALARDIANAFGLSWSGAGIVERTNDGFRIQMLYRMSSPQAGNHFNHVHLGVKRV